MVAAGYEGEAHMLYFEQAGIETARLRYAMLPKKDAARLADSPLATWVEGLGTRNFCNDCHRRAALVARVDGTASGVFVLPGTSDAGTAVSTTPNTGSPVTRSRKWR